MRALGLIEVYSFTTAVTVADIAAKAADVKVIAFDRNRPISPDVPVPLVMVVKIEGNVAAVEAAIDAGVDYAKSENKYIVSHIIPRPDDQTEKMAYLLDINRDKYNKKLPKTMLGYEAENTGSYGAIGLFEISGMVAAVQALDAMVKASDVRIIHTEKRLGGRLVTLIVTGEVSAVRASLEAANEQASHLGPVYGVNCIARPHSEIMKFFDTSIEE